MNPKEVSQSWEEPLGIMLDCIYLNNGKHTEQEVIEYVRKLLTEQARGIKDKCEEMKKKDVVITAYYPDSDTPDPDNSILLKENYGHNKALDSLADYITNTYL